VFYHTFVERERLFEVGRRTFDTPEFRGIEYIEVEARSVINRVPGNFLPFKWTINPYRGCSHACSYCTVGETPVLMADGQTKPIAELRVGDDIYGTERIGAYRRYVNTRVLAHWSTVKPAYRIRLDDGTELISSGDHLFLSDRGWKHVVNNHGGQDRAHLTLNNRLIGTGQFARGPEGTADYRRGYLCGMIRGDAHLRSSAYVTAGGTRTLRHHFRLALVDLEGLQRTREYPTARTIPTRTFLFQEAIGARKEMHAIGSTDGRHIAAIQDACSWPVKPSLEWCKGFLAGIFDAEGSYSESLRISNSDAAIIDRITWALRDLDFSFTVEPTRPNGVTNVRLLGGLTEALKFFHTVDPALTRKRVIAGRAVKNHYARLRVVSIEDLGIELPMYDITTGTGDFIANGVVSHNCFARVTHTYMDMNAGRDFESKIVVKVNAPEVLRRQLGSRKWKGEHIAMGTATDPYQRGEGRYRLMPGIIRALADYRNPFSILTKGTLILRDLDLLKEAAQVTDVGAALSIGTLDEDAWRTSEPGTPHPRKRIEAVAALNGAGIPTGVMMAPILPGITDHPDQLREVVKAAIDAGATHVSPIMLHLRPVVKEEFMPWLAEHYPDLVPRYERMYRTAYGPATDRKDLSARVSELVQNESGLRPRPGMARRSHRRPSPPPRATAKPEQLSLLEAEEGEKATARIARGRGGRG
jgi:DNA repair photolyase